MGTLREDYYRDKVAGKPDTETFGNYAMHDVRVVAEINRLHRLETDILALQAWSDGKFDEAIRLDSLNRGSDVHVPAVD